jgi:hypothetical protein
MSPSNMDIAEIIHRLRNVPDKKEIHEYDSIERFVVPIIEIAEWDIHSISPLILRRGNQDRISKHRRFDIELYHSIQAAPRFVFECKRLCDNINLIGKGDLRNLSDQSDFARQIKDDCLSGNYRFRHGWTSPILTNGEKWVIFKGEFTNPTRANEVISNANYNDFVNAESSLTDPDFEDKIISFLKYKGA